MPTAFVTGATGFLGRNIAEALIKAGWDVTALIRATSHAEPLQAMGANLELGNIAAVETLTPAIPEGVDCVFHVAGDISLWRGHVHRLESINIRGTENMTAAAQEKGAKRFVHTSSIAVYGNQPGQLTENAVQLGRGSSIDYARTKARAEEVVQMAVLKGLDAVILNPAAIVGRYDVNGFARMFKMMQDKQMPGVPPGSNSFACVREVAKAHIRAAEVGRTGENYLLGGDNQSYLIAVQEAARLLGTKAPKSVTPRMMLKAVARVEEWLAKMGKREPQFTREMAQLVCQYERVDSAKAEAELDYRIVPIAESLVESYDWLVEEGHLLKFS